MFIKGVLVIKSTMETDLDRAVKKSQGRWFAFGHPNWNTILREKNYPLTDIENYKNVIDWNKVWKYQRLTKNFLIKYRSRINYEQLSMNPYLTPDIITEFMDGFMANVSIRYEILHRILQNPQASPETIAAVLSNSKYSYEMISILEKYKFAPEVMDLLRIERYWAFKDVLAQYHNLTPEFMIKHKNALNWDLICRYQRLTIAFIESNKTLIQWKELAYNKHLTRDIILKYRELLPATEEIDNILNK